MIDIIETIDDPFYAPDREWRFTYINRHAETLWGRRREDLLGYVIWNVFPQAIGSEAYRAHHRAVETGETIRMTLPAVELVRERPSA
jgi:PAS domain S-box-containing protein